MCVYGFADVGVSGSTDFWPSTFRLVRLKPYVDALQTFTWQKQPGQDVGTPKERSKGEACLHM